MDRRMISAGTAGLVASALAWLPASATAQADMQDVEIRTVPVAEGVHMLMGRGGNIGVSTGDDGVFLVDDQYAPLTDRIVAAVRALSNRPIRFVINTHWHGDHTGGNENFGQAGAIIVAHENVRARMSTEQFIAAFDSRTPPAPPDALPVVTFADAVTFHWNGEEIRVFHVDPAHTDGDAIVHFVRANAIHMGDTYFNGLYPFIDVSSGGSLNGMIDAVDRVLAVANDQTKLIPGHGPLSDIEELMAYRRLLLTVRDRVQELIAQGKSREDVIAAKPTAEFDALWGDGFLSPDQWVGIVYDALEKPR